MNNQLKVITLDTLNKKDALTDDKIKKINNSLVSALKSIESTLVDFNKSL